MAADGNRRSSVSSRNVRVGISDASLLSKTRIDVPDDSLDVCWYIKFNITLDPETVSSETMTVTETNGFILETEIYYDLDKNLILIKPTDPYEEGIFYILTITRKVRSQGGNRLKHDIYVVFKIRNNRIDSYELLPAATAVEKPRKKPEKLKKETAARARAAGLVVPKPSPRQEVRKAPARTVPYGKFRINLLLPAVAIPVALSGLHLDIQIMVIVGAVLLTAGIIHLSLQLANKKRRAAVTYNFGAMFFNSGFHKAAHKRFKKANALDPDNELAKKAMQEV